MCRRGLPEWPPNNAHVSDTIDHRSGQFLKVEIPPLLISPGRRLRLTEVTCWSKEKLHLLEPSPLCTRGIPGGDERANERVPPRNGQNPWLCIRQSLQDHSTLIESTLLSEPSGHPVFDVLLVQHTVFLIHSSYILLKVSRHKEGDKGYGRERAVGEPRKQGE